MRSRSSICGCSRGGLDDLLRKGGAPACRTCACPRGHFRSAAFAYYGNLDREHSALVAVRTGVARHSLSPFPTRSIPHFVFPGETCKG